MERSGPSDCFLRRIEFWDEEQQRLLVFLTNNLKLAASTIAAVYKDRWQIELLFKALKQSLRIKTFVGTTANALKTQIWTALIALLAIKYLQMRASFELVVIQSGGLAAPAAVRLPGSVGLAE